MCATCGCGEDAGVRVTRLGPAHEHPHEHQHEHLDEHLHEHPHEHPHEQSRVVEIETDLLAKNDLLAAENRTWLARRGVLVLNLMSSPGSGKTTLLERSIRALTAPDASLGWPAVAVVEGDQETALDARRIRATGAEVVQVNTGAGCHLDADMLARGLRSLDPPPGSLVFVENVGNLVCPALFDLGEAAKVVVVSVTEGEDKPLKYPQMFAAADLVLINKTDLLPHLDVDLDRLAGYVRQVNPGAEILPVSATHGNGMDAWYGWVCDRVPRDAAPPSASLDSL